MNNHQPKFHAPIPEYADLNFLFYRWGYDQLGEKAIEVFSKNMGRYYERSGLRYYSLGKNYILIKQPSETDDWPFQHDTVEDVWFISNKKLKRLGYSIESNSYRPMEILGLFDSDTPEVEVTAFQGNDESYLLPAGVYPLDYLSSSIYDEEDIKNTSHFFVKELFLEYSDIYVEKNNLTAFEQKIGFYNHGLTDDEVEKFVPKSEINESQKKGHNLEKINEARKLKNVELIATYEEFTKVQEQNPSWGVTAIREEVADKLNISGEAVRKRLLKLKTK